LNKDWQKKLAAPLANIINSTPAVSLLYECIKTCTIGLADHLPTIKLCITKLRSFVEDPDQNLKYLGLVALHNIMQIHPKAVAEHRDLVLNCLDDDDTSIRLRALNLIEGMVTKKNIAEIVHKLLDHVEKSEGSYRDQLVQTIIAICSKNNYASLSDFEWYISVLMQISHVNGIKDGKLIAEQFMDIIIRVAVIRSFGVKNMVNLIRSEDILLNVSSGTNSEVLFAAGYIIGEFNKFVTNHVEVVEALLNPRVSNLPAHIQGIYMSSAFKIFGVVASTVASPQQDKDMKEKVDETTLLNVIDILKEQLPTFSQSPYSEVQERACFILEVLKLYSELGNNSGLTTEIASILDETLNPVAPKAQRKVPVPEDLDLESWINEPPPEKEYKFEDQNNFDAFGKYSSDEENDDPFANRQPTPEELEQRKKLNAERNSNNKFYLGSGHQDVPSFPNDENSPSKGNTPLVEDPKRPVDKYRASKPKSKKHHKPVTVAKVEDIEGGSSEDEKEKKEDPFANIDLTVPLRPGESLPTRQHYVPKVSTPTAHPEQKQEKKPKKEKKRETRQKGKETQKRKRRKKGLILYNNKTNSR